MSACDKNQNTAETRAGKLITELRVRELKSELEKRGLDSQGVKVVLTVRLSKALREDGLEPEKYLFQTMAATNQETPTVETSEEVKTDESESAPDVVVVAEVPPPSSDVVVVDVVKRDSDDSDSLKIVEDSQETPAADEPVVEEKKEEILNVEVKKENVEDVPRVEVKSEPDVEEELEGEDEFEEVEEEQEQEVEKVEAAATTTAGADDEIFLDDEDLLEDPLDEQPIEEEKKRAESVASTVPTTVASTNPSRDGTPLRSSAGTKAFLFADDAKKTSIWIRGMTPATKASSVKQLASQFGKVLQSKIFNSKPINGEIKNCFAFVTFADAESMDAAIAALHRKDHQGRMLRVEKVAESHLTGSAERIAKEKQDSDVKKQHEAQQQQQEKKKRAVIQAPENPKRNERQTIQAPERKNNRAVIQAPEVEDKEKARRDRKPIVYKMSPGKPAKRVYEEEETRGRSSERDRDSRRTISAAAPNRRTVSPPVHRSSRAARAAGEPSLIISARVDTRGQPIKRSVERHVPSSITTSQLRRNPIHVARSPPPRAAYQTQQYTTNARDVRDARSVRDTRDSSRGDHHRDVRDHHRRDVNSGSSAIRHSSSSSSSVPAPRDTRRDQRREDSSRHRSGASEREREMLEILRRKEEEHRLREEKLEMQREREKMKFEAEKLERAKLELELSKQKLALQAALLSENKYQVPSGGDRSSRSLNTSATTGNSSRRRQADHFSPPSRSSKVVHMEDRSSRGRSDSGRHTGSSSAIPSARHVATAYGIQSSNGNSIGGSTNVNYHGNSATTKDYRSSGSTSYDTTSAIGGFQNYATTGYGSGGYQSQVWNGYDASGMTMSGGGPQWNAATASASTSTNSTTTGGGASQWQYNSTTRGGHRDYNTYPGRSNY